MMWSTCHEHGTKKKLEFPTVIEPMTFCAPVGCSNHCAKKNSWLAGPFRKVHVWHASWHVPCLWHVDQSHHFSIKFLFELLTDGEREGDPVKQLQQNRIYSRGNHRDFTAFLQKQTNKENLKVCKLLITRRDQRQFSPWTISIHYQEKRSWE